RPHPITWAAGLVQLSRPLPTDPCRLFVHPAPASTTRASPLERRAHPGEPPAPPRLPHRSRFVFARPCPSLRSLTHAYPRTIACARAHATSPAVLFTGHALSLEFH
ncbi:hypothetical protein FS749_009401, partial [Ceratobasidium sp. UAMH 11750]